MRNQRRVKFFIGKCLSMVLVVLFVLNNTNFIYATEKDDIKNTIKNEQDKLEQAQDKISQFEAQQLELEMQLDDQKSEMINLMKDVEKTKVALENKKEEIEKAQEKYDETNKLKDEQYAAMVIRIQYMYESGDDNALLLLFSSDSFEKMLNKAEYVDSLYDYDKNVLQVYQMLMNEVEEQKIKLDEEKEVLEMQEKTLASQENELKNIMENLEAEADDFAYLVSNAKTEAKKYKNNIKQNQNKLNQIIKEEEERAKAEAEAEAEANRPKPPSQNNGSANIGSSSSSKTGNEIAAYAQQFVGNPYVWGGVSLTNGADCSGFIMTIYKQYGYSLPHSSYSMRSSGKASSLADAQPGDIICYSGHVALYIGNGRIVHAKSSKAGIVTDPVYYGWGGTGPQVLAVRRIL